jgi:RNA polymerase sigma-70 factor, ECF subfamily
MRIAQKRVRDRHAPLARRPGRPHLGVAHAVVRIDTTLLCFPTLNGAMSSDSSKTRPAGDAPIAPAGVDALDDADRAVLDAVFSEAYDELRRLAARVRASDAGATISPTALVNEAWLKLADSPQVARTSRLHFKRIAARAMRQVLVEAARRRQSEKRGGDAEVITFDDSLMSGPTASDQLLALDDALSELARLSPRQAMMVEARFFGGLELHETAELLAVSESTVLRDWRSARAWLGRTLQHG